MSRFAKKVGQKSMRFQFDVTVNFVEVHIPIEAEVMVIWKRGAKRIETRAKVHISPDNPRGEFNETMSMLATLSNDVAKGKYMEKNTNFTVKLITDTKMKSIGMIKLNLGKFADKPDLTEEFPLKKCPDRNATIGLTIKSTLIQADCKDADTLSQMTDLRSLDSAPDSQYDFTELNKEREEETPYSKMNPDELFQKDADRQKRGLPPMFGGSGSSAFKNISSSQFSLKSKAATSTMASLHSGPIKPNKLASKDNISETPEKMEDCDITTDEEGTIGRSPRDNSAVKSTPDSSDMDSNDTPKVEKSKKVIKSSAISKINKRSQKQNEPAFSYHEGDRSPKHSRIESSMESRETASFKTREIVEEVKDLRLKIRSLESEKRALKEDSIKIKQQCSEEIRKAINASSSDDQKVELLQHSVSELEAKNDKLELKSAKKDNEMEKLKRKIEDKDIDIENIKKKRGELHQKITDAEEKVRQMSIEMKGFREQIGNYEQENVALKKEIATLNTAFNRTKEENQELTDMVEKLRDQMENKRVSIKQSPSIGDDEFDDYKVTTEALISDYKSQIKELEKKVDDANNDYEKLAHDKEYSDKDLFMRLQNANRKIDMLQQSESSLKTTVTELEKRTDDLIQERLERERTGMDSQSEISGKYKSIEIQYKQTLAKLEDREKKLKALEGKITHIEEEKLYFISNEEQKREEMLYDYKNEIEELKDKIVKLENQNDHLLIEKDDLDQRLNRHMDRDTTSDGILQGNEKLLSQIKKLQGQVTEKDGQILELQNEVDKAGTGKRGKMSR